MSILFNKEEIKRFFEILHEPTDSKEKVYENTRQAVALIADILHLGRVAGVYSVPESVLRKKIDNDIVLLLEKPEYSEENPVVLNFRTGDGGSVVVTFNSEAGYCWDDEEIRNVRIVANVLFGVLRQEMLGSLLKHVVTMDLTVGIPNISAYMQFAGRIMEQKQLEHYVAVYINARNFKYVNKVLPHPFADEVMKKYSVTLAELAAEGEMVARLGGDNFVALLREENADAFFDKVSNIRITYNYEGNEKRFGFGATIGVSRLEGISNIGEIMTRISVAYQVARNSEKSIVHFNEALYESVMKQKETLAGFGRALKRQEFVVYYQPKVSTSDLSLCGAEALVRWRMPDGKLKPPGEFIPILEKSGSICELDFYVLDKVCELLKRCENEGIERRCISVNFSRKHMTNPNLVEDIVAVIDRHNIPHEYIEIELTESEDFRDYVVMAKLVEGLKNQGLSTSIDDFGTGYSSLNMLKMASIDLLKIDRSFIPVEEGYNEKTKECIMFQHIAHLAKALGFKIVTEGVETGQQYEYLKNAGCDMVQGFYFDRPLPEDEFLKKLVIGKYTIDKEI